MPFPHLCSAPSQSYFCSVEEPFPVKVIPLPPRIRGTNSGAFASFFSKKPNPKSLMEAEQVSASYHHLSTCGNPGASNLSPLWHKIRWPIFSTIPCSLHHLQRYLLTSTTPLGNRRPKSLLAVSLLAGHQSSHL